MKTSSPPQHKSISLFLAPPANRSITLDEAIQYELKHGRRKVDPSMDRKMLRRMISNRLSAQRSRRKRSQYIDDLEKMAKDLEIMISVLTSQIESKKEQTEQLHLQNESLQKLVEIRSNESRISEAELEQKRVELCRLQELAKNSYDPCLGRQQMKDVRFDQSASQPYSLEFYQNSLCKLGSNQINQEQVTSCVVVQSEPKTTPTFVFEEPEGEDQQPGFTAEQPVEALAQEKVQDEEDIDQYLNFEELNLHQAGVRH